MTSQSTAKGILWSGIDRLSSQGVQFIVQIILARLLAPEEFGIIAIASTINYIFLTINEQGFSTALMYKKDRTEGDYSTVFWSNILIAFFSYLLLYLLSPFIASFFKISQLVSVVRLLGLNLFFQSFYLVPATIFTITIDFKTQAKATLLSSIISGFIGVGCAYYLRNVYALVIQSISYQLLYGILLLYYSSWKPTWYFSLTSFKSLFSYGYKLIISRTISVLFDDLYTFGIGKVFSPTILGFYNRANSFKSIISNNIVHIFQRVSMPMLCKERDSIENMKTLLLKYLASSALIICPILAGLMILSKPFILVLLTEKWIETANILQYLCPIGFMYLISSFNRNIYNSTGRTDLALKMEFIKKVIFLIIFIISIQYNFRVVVYSQIVMGFVELMIDTSVAGKLIGLSLFKELYALRKILIATVMMSIIVCIIKSCFLNPHLQLIIGIIGGAVSYSIICIKWDIVTIRGLKEIQINFHNLC